MPARSSPDPTIDAALARPLERGLSTVGAFMLLSALLATALTAVRLDALAARAPGVWYAGQLLPVHGQMLGDGEEASVSGPSADLRAALAPLSSDVAVTHWTQAHQRVVAVGAAAVDDPARVARTLNEAPPSTGLQATRAWDVGDRFVVILGVSVPAPGDVEAFATRVTEQVRTAIRFQIGAWYAGSVVVLPVMATLSFGVFVALPISLLTLLFFPFIRRRWNKRPPRETEMRPAGLTPYTTVVDLKHDESFADEVDSTAAEGFAHPVRTLARGLGDLGTSDPERAAQRDEREKQRTEAMNVAAKRYNRRRFKGLPVLGAFLLALAIPALTPRWWPSSILWSSLLGEWLVLGLMRKNWTFTSRGDRRLRMARWALALCAVAVIVDNVVEVSPVRLGHSPILIGPLAAVAFGNLLLYWRSRVADVTTPFDVRTSALATVYLVSTLLFAVSASCLIFGSSADPILRSGLLSKALGLVLLVVFLPMAVRRHRAADLASRRASARAQGTPEVILLRAFVDDHLRIRSRRVFRNQLETLYYRSTEPFEDVVARAFGVIGPVVAIAEPGTEQGEFGASRDRITAEDWLTAVRAALRSSGYVVVILGAGEGLTAEIRALRELEVLDRICLIVPPVSPTDAAARLSYITGLLDGPGEWGRIQIEAISGRRIMALVGEGSQRFVVTWDMSSGRLDDRVNLLGRHDSSEALMRLGTWIQSRRLALPVEMAPPSESPSPT